MARCGVCGGGGVVASWCGVEAWGRPCDFVLWS